jgi:NifU-like protein involved in Fe-S cluster formation
MVMDQGNHPRNAGVIEDAGGVDEVGHPRCGGVMTFCIKDDILVDPRPGLHNLAMVA